MKFLVLLALAASASAFSYSTGTAHPAGYAYRTLAPYNYANTYASYNPYGVHAFRSYATAHPVASVNYGYNVAHAAPVAEVVTHEVASPVLKTVVAPAVPVATPTYYTHQSYAPATTQYRQQNELGEYQFGYSGDTSARDEVRTADGVVQGQYSYIDANNIPQKVNYVADALGFRVSGTNVPAAPAPAAVVHAVHAPAHVEHHVEHHAVDPVHHTHHVQTVVKSALLDEVNPHVPYTPEVAAARADHLAALSTAAHAAAAPHHVLVKRSAAGFGYGSYGRSHGGYGSHGGRAGYGSSYGRRSGYGSSYGRRSGYSRY